MSEEASPLCKGLEVFILPSLGLAKWVLDWSAFSQNP